MKKFLTLVCVSALGGALTLGAYNYFFEAPGIPKTIENEPQSTLFPVNFKPHLAGGTNVDFTTAANKTVHSVVHVKNTSSSDSDLPAFYRYFYGDDQLPERIGTGSGVIVSPNGYIITNHHVIENNSEIEITTNDNKTYS